MWDFIYFPRSSSRMQARPHGRSEATSALYRNAAKKEPAFARICDARRRQGDLPFESDFGTSDILAAVGRKCISPVRD
jgi:hypothetical protein